MRADLGLVALDHPVQRLPVDQAALGQEGLQGAHPRVHLGELAELAVVVVVAVLVVMIVLVVMVVRVVVPRGGGLLGGHDQQRNGLLRHSPAR